MISPAQLANLLTVLGMDSIQTLAISDAGDWATRHALPFPPDAPALITGIETEARLQAVCAVLHTTYPLAHPLRLVRGAEVADSSLETARGEGWEALFIPPLATGASFESFQEIIAHLRAPDGCPWDREQTHLTLRKHLLEESYETLAAMDDEDPAKMREEFGDLLLQIVLNAQIGVEAGTFNMAGITQGIYEKIIRRHPHVFGEVQVGGAGDVLSNWEALKKEERKKKGEHEKSLLDGLPAALPALNQAQEFQDRAARVGFDWPEIDGVLEKVKEEIDEVKRAENPTELADELGDLFFALVNLARWKKVDAESALREASQKFKRRFVFVERRAQALDRPMKGMTIAELDALWNEAKQNERN